MNTSSSKIVVTPKVNASELTKSFVEAFGTDDKQVVIFRRVCNVRYSRDAKVEQRIYTPTLSESGLGENDAKKILATPKSRVLSKSERKSNYKEKDEYDRVCAEFLLQGSYELEVERNSSDELQGKKLVCTSETQGFFDIWNDFKFQTFEEAEGNGGEEREKRDRVVPRRGDLIMIKTAPLSRRKTSEKHALVWCLVTDQFMKLVCKICYPGIADYQGPDDDFQPDETDFKKRERSWYFSGNRLMTQSCWRKRILGFIHNQKPLSLKKESLKKMFRWGRAEPEAAYVHTWTMFFLLMEYQEAPSMDNIPNNIIKKCDANKEYFPLKKWDVDFELLKHLNTKYSLGIGDMLIVDEWVKEN